MGDAHAPFVATESNSHTSRGDFRDLLRSEGLHIDTTVTLPSSSAVTRISSPVSTMSTSCPTLLSSRTSPCGSFNSESDPRTPVTDFGLLDTSLKAAFGPTSYSPSHRYVLAVPHAPEFVPEQHAPRAPPLPTATSTRDVRAPTHIELDDVRWMAGVPRHMVGVFRADPFTSSELSPDTSGSSAYSHIFGHGALGSTYDLRLQGRVPPPFPQGGFTVPSPRNVKRVHPNSPVTGKKSRGKRRRVETPPPLPFPATGPQKMFSHEFRVNMQDCGAAIEQTQAKHASDGQAYPTAALDSFGRWIAPRPTEELHPMDVDIGGPRQTRQEYMEPAAISSMAFSPIPLSAHTSSPSPSFGWPSQQAYSEPTYHVPTPQRLFLPGFELSPSTSLRSWDFDSQAQNHPARSDFGVAHAFGGAAVPAPPSCQSRVDAPRVRTSSLPSSYSLDGQGNYMCPLCPRSFQLPNGLALHLKWHERVDGLKLDDRGGVQAEARSRTGCVGESGDATPEERVEHRRTSSGMPSAMSMSIDYQSNLTHAGQWGPAYDPVYHFESGHRPQEGALFPGEQQRVEVLTPADSAFLTPLEGLPILDPLPFGQAPWIHDGLGAATL